MSKKFWDSQREIGRIQKNDKGDQIIISIVTKGHGTYVDVRTYYVNKVTGDLMPSKGIAIPNDLADEVAIMIMDSGIGGCRRCQGTK